MGSSRATWVPLALESAVWGAAVALIAARGRTPAPPWSPWVGVAATLLAIGAAVDHLRRPRAERRLHVSPLVLAVAGPVLFTVIVRTGGVRSPAAPTAALFVLAYAHARGMARAALTGGVAIALVAAADLWLRRSVSLPVLTALAAVVLAGGLVPAWHARRTARVMAVERQQLARVQGYLAARPVTPLGVPALASDLRADSELLRRQVETQRDLWELDRFLRDIRDATGADEAVFWRWNEARSAQRPAAWSSEDALAPQYFDWERHAAVVKWTAEGELAQCVAVGEAATFIAAPVTGKSGVPYGVLSVSARAGLALPPAPARDWASRYAQQLALMVELLDLRRDYKRHMRQSGALGNAARLIQQTSKLDELGQAICATALEVTSGSRSALVQWRGPDASGEVQAVSARHPIPLGLRVTDDSYLARQCQAGEALYKHDARLWGRNGVVYGAGEPRREIGSVAIVPLHQERRVVGALVVEGDAVEAVGVGEVRNLKTLAGFASTALAVAWEIEEAGRRARTDPLTGLANRRYFDERLEDLLNQADRFGSGVALVIADIDFFKQVNDNYGHDAGDAVLRHVAQVFVELKRAVDLCARYGGEEIAILMPHTGLAGALEGAERFRAGLASRPVRVAAREISVTASFGVASYPESVRAREGLFAAADRALYQAKSDGRNCIKSASSTGSGLTP